MRSLVPATAFCLVATAVLAVETPDLLGTWRLVSAKRKIVETGEVRDAYGGPNPTGWLTYGRDGRMMVICAFEGREKPVANDRMTDEDRVRLHKTFFAYAGTYVFDGRTVTHAIDTSWNEVWTGTAQVRDVAYDTDRITITTPPFKFNVDGQLSIITLVWERHR